MKNINSKARKTYVIQYRLNNRWYDVPCRYNGKYVQDCGLYEGNTRKPSQKIMDNVMRSRGNFVNEDYRVSERTIVLVYQD